jgi:prepilin-type N-terminal cleavage/methylation domain-containing protein
MIKKNYSGFTIVEISIVLVIIALIVGAVSSGTNLLSHAKLRSLITSYNSLQVAIKSFKLAYNYLPGDFPKATTYWAASATCIAGDVNSNTTYCNGNGDGMISGSISSNNASAEGTRALQHLALGGFIKGNYVGGSNLFTLGTTIYPVAIDNSGYNILYSAASSNLSSRIYNSIGNYLALTREIATGQPGGGAISPQDAYYIDQKIDDSLPSTGNTLAYTPYASNSSYYVDNSNNCTETLNGKLIYSYLEQDRACAMYHSIK